MTVLNVTYADPTGINAPRYGVLNAALQEAMTAWTSHFDAPQGSVTINVTFGGIPSTESAAAGPNYIFRIGGPAASAISISAFAYEITTGAVLPAYVTTGSLFIDQSFFTYAFGAASPHPAVGLQVLEHEIGHMLGFVSYSNAPIGAGPRLTFDNYVQTNGPAETFNGPNAIAQYGRPITMDHATYVHPYVGGGVSVMSYLQPAATVQPLDVAILRDTGLPILTDQEIQEHAVARLYLAGLGRGADGPGLLNAARALLNGTSLNDIAKGILSSPEYTARYGAAVTDGAFVTALYQNLLHRAPDAGGAANHLAALARGTSRTTLLISFSDSAENRVLSEVNANTTYAATAEAQMERLYDTAFGRAPDPSGYAAFTHALLNGTTLQQAAMSFIGSPEFNQRYGATSDQGLVDAYYINTLHRPADAAGEANFLAALRGGRLSAADLMVSFSESPEHQANVIARDTATNGSYLADTSPHLGSIPVYPVLSFV